MFKKLRTDVEMGNSHYLVTMLFPKMVYQMVKKTHLVVIWHGHVTIWYAYAYHIMHTICYRMRYATNPVIMASLAWQCILYTSVYIPICNGEEGGFDIICNDSFIVSLSSEMIHFNLHDMWQYCVLLLIILCFHTCMGNPY